MNCVSSSLELHHTVVVRIQQQHIESTWHTANGGAALLAFCCAGVHRVLQGSRGRRGRARSGLRAEACFPGEMKTKLLLLKEFSCRPGISVLPGSWPDRLSAPLTLSENMYFRVIPVQADIQEALLYTLEKVALSLKDT